MVNAQINEFSGQESRNFRSYCQRLIQHVNVGLLVRLEQYLSAPDGCPPDEVLALTEEVQEATKHFRIRRLCPTCGTKLYLSDLPQYNYVCYTCDKNI